MTRIFAFFILLLFISFTSYGQEDWLVTSKGDSLSGKISISSVDNGHQIITLKSGKNKSRFQAYEIRSLVNKEQVFHPLKINKVYQLGLLKKEGYLSLYLFMDSEESSSNEFATEILIRRDGTQLIVPNIGFKKRTKDFLADCDLVQETFENNGYKKNDLEQIVDDYNKCISAETTRLYLVKTAKNFDQEKTRMVEVLMEDIKKDGNIEEMESTLEMLADLESKIRKGEKIPAYLKTGLQSSLKNNQAFTDRLNQILE